MFIWQNMNSAGLAFLFSKAMERTAPRQEPQSESRSPLSGAKGFFMKRFARRMDGDDHEARPVDRIAKS